MPAPKLNIFSTSAKPFSWAHSSRIQVWRGACGARDFRTIAAVKSDLMTSAQGAISSGGHIR